MTPQQKVDKADAIYRWILSNLKVGMHVKFAGSRSNRVRGQYRVVDRLIPINAVASAYVRGDGINTTSAIATGLVKRVDVLSHNQSEYKNFKTGEIKVVESTDYATNNGATLSQVKINGVWESVPKLIRPLLTKT